MFGDTLALLRREVSTSLQTHSLDIASRGGRIGIALGSMYNI